MILSGNYGELPEKRNAFYSTVLVTIVVATLLAVPTAIADVFHGRWIRGAIEETYVRLGGHAVWGDAISDETPGARGGTNQHFYNDASIFGILMSQVVLRAKSVD